MMDGAFNLSGMGDRGASDLAVCERGNQAGEEKEGAGGLEEATGDYKVHLCTSEGRMSLRDDRLKG